jgi:hypothetical protein
MKTLGPVANRLVTQFAACDKQRKRIVDDMEICTRKCKRCTRMQRWKRRPQPKAQPALVVTRKRKHAK